MKVLHWLYSKRKFADLVIDKAPDVLFVVVAVTFFLLTGYPLHSSCRE